MNLQVLLLWMVTFAVIVSCLCVLVADLFLRHLWICFQLFSAVAAAIAATIFSALFLPCTNRKGATAGLATTVTVIIVLASLRLIFRAEPLHYYCHERLSSNFSMFNSSSEGLAEVFALQLPFHLYSFMAFGVRRMPSLMLFFS
jgi:Na+/proline symporter